jgi:hypothetical protein
MVTQTYKSANILTMIWTQALNSSFEASWLVGGWQRLGMRQDSHWTRWGGSTLGDRFVN